jgi:acyl phosphate:glycerol-3-phosphate acyltransferase
MFDPVSWGTSWPYFLAALAAGYLLGSIPFGLVLTRLAGLGDIRNIGSGNIGATNVLRTGNKKLAVLTLLLDGGKGAAAVLLGRYLFDMDIAMLAGLGAFLGHLYPVWLKFKGGKGVATTLGILFAVNFLLGAAAALTWLLVAFIFRFSSLAALISLAAAPAYAFWLIGDQAAIFVAILAVISWLRHHENIRRLLKGEESRIKLGSKKPEPAPPADSA